MGRFDAKKKCRVYPYEGVKPETRKNVIGG